NLAIRHAIFNSLRARYAQPDGTLDEQYRQHNAESLPARRPATISHDWKRAGDCRRIRGRTGRPRRGCRWRRSFLRTGFFKPGRRYDWRAAAAHVLRSVGLQYGSVAGQEDQDHRETKRRSAHGRTEHFQSREFLGRLRSEHQFDAIRPHHGYLLRTPVDSVWAVLQILKASLVVSCWPATLASPANNQQPTTNCYLISTKSLARAAARMVWGARQ